MKLLDGFKLFFNPVWVMDNFLTLWGGGGGSQTSTGTTYTTNVPEYMQPYFEQTMKSAASNVYTTDANGNVTGVKPMPTYTGERVAGFNADQTDVQNQIKALTESGNWAAANDLMKNAGNFSSDLANSGYARAMAYKPEDFQSEKFNAAAAKEYMSPYQQNVTDMALREANKQAAIDQKNAMLGSLGRGQGMAGTSGRNAIMQSQMLLNKAQNAADIQAKGSQSAYENAQKQFEADQARRLGAYTARGQQQQFNANLGQQMGAQGLANQINSSKGLADLASAQQTATLERLKAKASSAAEKQALQQKIDDVNYQTAMEQRDWEKKQLEWINAMIHGTSGLASTQVQYAPSASALSQLGGLGLGGLSLAKALG
jgi:hypothetical protein